MIRRFMNKSFKILLVLLGLNLVYLLYLSATYLIPLDKIKENIGNSLYTWENVEETDAPIFDDIGFYIDTLSDLIWANAASQTQNNPVRAAIELKNTIAVSDATSYNNLVAALYYGEQSESSSYSRYWNLVIGHLKILFCFMEISSIRFLLYGVSSILMGWLLLVVRGRLGLPPTIALFTSMLLVTLNLHAVCLSFAGDIILALVAMLAVVYFAGKRWFEDNLGVFFAIVGSLTFAAGPLVTPLLTLGLPLILYLQMHDELSDKNANAWLRVIEESAWWVVGYGVTLFFKQGISFYTLGAQTGTSQILMWFGKEITLLDRIQILINNFSRVFSPNTIKVPFFSILFALLVIGSIFFYKKKSNTKLLMILALYPIFWILIIARHSQHSFASNNLIIFIYAILLILIEHIDFTKLKKTHFKSKGSK